MKTLQCIAAAAIAAVCVACNDAPRAVIDPAVNATVVVPGNEPALPDCSPDPSCLAPVDAAIKVLYERNNRLSEPGEGTTELIYHGESRYAAASRANYSLGRVYLAEEMNPGAAAARLRRYISDVTRFQREGEFSECAANQLINRANWILGAINAASEGGFNAAELSSMLANPTSWDCQLSPITATPAMTDAGLSLNVVDPWGFQTWYNVKLPGGAIQQFTSAIFVDSGVNAAGEYVYELQQCSDVLGCSAWTALTVTVPVSAEVCPHDNRDKSLPGRSPLCARD